MARSAGPGYPKVGRFLSQPTGALSLPHTVARGHSPWSGVPLPEAPPGFYQPSWGVGGAATGPGLVQRVLRPTASGRTVAMANSRGFTLPLLGVAQGGYGGALGSGHRAASRCVSCAPPPFRTSTRLTAGVPLAPPSGCPFPTAGRSVRGGGSRQPPRQGTPHPAAFPGGLRLPRHTSGTVNRGRGTGSGSSYAPFLIRMPILHMLHHGIPQGGARPVKRFAPSLDVPATEGAPPEYRPLHLGAACVVHGSSPPGRCDICCT